MAGGRGCLDKILLCAAALAVLAAVPLVPIAIKHRQEEADADLQKALKQATTAEREAERIRTKQSVLALKQNKELSEKFGTSPEKSGEEYPIIKTYLKSIAKDPDSVRIYASSNVAYNDKHGWLVKCDWSGKNSFGGVDRNTNWFVVKMGVVAEMLPSNAFK